MYIQTENTSVGSLSCSRMSGIVYLWYHLTHKNIKSLKHVLTIRLDWLKLNN